MRESQKLYLVKSRESAVSSSFGTGTMSVHIFYNFSNLDIHLNASCSLLFPGFVCCIMHHLFVLYSRFGHLSTKQVCGGRGD